MTYTLKELASACLGLLTLPIFFLAPGYVAASMCNLANFRNQGWIERLLWSTALSAPVAILLANHPIIGLSPFVTDLLFVCLLAVAFSLMFRDSREDGAFRLHWDRSATYGVCGAVFLILYCLLGSLPLQFHGRLYESSVWQDWNVRIQLVNAAIRGGNVPGNPMFAPHGHAAPLRYYYFWYILCARMHDVAHMTARAAFAVSCVGAALSLLAFLFLSLKYIGETNGRLRATCIALMAAACILGLDLLALIPLTLGHHIYPNVQFWLQDRTPRLLQVILWSPHHGAGLVCAGMGILLLVCCQDLTRRQRIAHMVVAGVCWAAAAGTSTFVTALLGSALLFVALDAALRKEWDPVWMAAGAAVLALALDASFLHQLVATQAGARHIGTAEPLLRPLPRFMNQALQVIWLGLDEFGRLFLQRRIYPHGPSPQGHMKLLLTVLHRPIIPIFFFMDLGFFSYVLFWQARKDFLWQRPMDRSARIRWLIFLGIAIPGTRFTSAALQANNDFARHAGLGMEYILLLWSAPILLALFEKVRARTQGSQAPRISWFQRVALACALIGWLGQIVQIVYDRVRVPLTDAGMVPRVVVAEYVPHIGFRFFQIEQAMAAAEKLTNTDGIVQQNPHTLLAPVFLLYTDRQMAASDDGCNTPFGGNPDECLALTRSLVSLYGGTGAAYFTDMGVLQKPIEFDPQQVTVDNFQRICSANKIDVLAVTYTDPVWYYRPSWVWSLRPVYANSTVRLYKCSTAVSSGEAA